MKPCLFALALIFLDLLSTRAAQVIATGETAPQRGVWETQLAADGAVKNPFCDVDLRFVFTLPDGREIKADGFFKGQGQWGGRAYCAQAGTWAWRSLSSEPSLNGKSGRFRVVASALPGKLRKHPQDPHQFMTDNGAWFLHLGDTCYRYPVDTEPLWQTYIDEASQVGFTKVRVWFCRSRGNVEALFTKDRTGLDLAYWDEIERRLAYALERHPHIQFQVILFGEDSRELARYGEGDRLARLMPRYAQARFSAFPNVQWCISNDRHVMSGKGDLNVSPDVINAIGRDMRAREPWGTLLSNHQQRFQGYSFAGADWSDIVTLEDRDQVAGALVLQYRALADDPAVIDEDRYGLYLSPKHDRFFFRRLMWSNLLSGGHATYGGNDMYEPFAASDKTKGVRGYITSVKEGVLEDGAHDFAFIATFFREAGITLAGFRPDDAMAGNNGHAVKVAASGAAILVYLQNADSDKPEAADVREAPASCRLHLPPGAWTPRWFDPRSGQWHGGDQPASGEFARDFNSPFNGDAVLLLCRSSP